MSSFLRRICRFLIPRRAAGMVALVALAWNSPAICGEIHDAAQPGDLAKVKELLEGNPDLVSSEDRFGFTPLHISALKGHSNIAELLLAMNADVNAVDKNGQTPLHWAAERGYAAIAKLLLAMNADVNGRSRSHNHTPLHVAAAMGRQNVAELLLASKADDNLPVPPFKQLPRDVVCWFRDEAGEPVQRMWDIASLLKECGVPVRLLRSARPGKILYEDDYQIVVEEWQSL